MTIGGCTSQDKVVGIIGGTGWLGSAMTEAILDSYPDGEFRVICSYRTPPEKTYSQIEYTVDNRYLIDKSDIVILSVRPQDWDTLKVTIHDKLILSVIAGLSLSEIQSRFGQDNKIIRAMPNTAASIRRSHTPWIATENTAADELNLVRKLVACFGAEDQCDTEDEVDYLTAISGAGSAYPALLSYALKESAIRFGIPAAVATRAANSVLIGGSSLIGDINNAPEDIVNAFIQYKGTTASGLDSMIKEGFVQSVSKGVLSAYKKSKEGLNYR